MENDWGCSRVDNTASNPDVCSLLCGNAALDAGEQCDDGNAIASDGCTNCIVDDDFTCSRVDSSNLNPDTCTHRCGNSALDSHGTYTEECDDSNIQNDDGCSDLCIIEDAYTC